MIEPKMPDHLVDWSKEVPKELWEQIIVEAENPALMTTCKLFKDIINDPAITTKNLSANFKDQFPFSKDLKEAKTSLIERLGTLLPQKIMDCFKNAENLHYFTFTKILNEEYCTNLRIIFRNFISEQIMDEFIEEPSYKKKVTLIHNAINENPDICNVQSLTITRSGLTLIPKEVNLFSGVLEVNFNYNKITTIPDCFGDKWKELYFCHLSNNELKTLPDDFGSAWERLYQIEISQNQIESLPDDFGSHWKELNSICLYNPIKLNENEFKEKTNENVRIFQ